MKPAVLTACAVGVFSLSACSRSDNAPRAEHSSVAVAMPDAATVPGAVGPATAAPHATPPPSTTALSAPQGGDTTASTTSPQQ